MSQQPFGTTPDGTGAQIYTLTNGKGMEARVTNYGGILVSLKVPDRLGNFGDVVMGFDRLEDYSSPEYLKTYPYFGALIGRYANRIKNGTFTLDGREYHVPTNEAQNALHGGKLGFDRRVWEAEEGESPRGPTLTLRYLSPDGEEGFPGTVQVQVTYTLTEENELILDYEATTDRPTVINLTEHSYFNLKGAGEGDILGHEMRILSSQFVPVDAEEIALGGLRDVAGTPFDFRQPTAIGARIDMDNEQLRNGKGYDHTFVREGAISDRTLYPYVHVEEPTSGRVLEVASTQPGVHFYAGNMLAGPLIGKGGKVYNRRGAFCLEPGNFVDSPNRPEFPSPVMRPGDTYRHTTVYRFSTLPRRF